ncbi:uncharacterized protein [Leptinotarsa decemlineata]|uniref:uncharacterized protein n=1 Tax=Leptinotarsa decemlineata TaxID=7539 RepID=UPI003D30BDAB
MNIHRRTLQHRTNACIQYGDGVKIIRTAFKCRIVSYRVDSQNHHIDYPTFFNELKQKVFKLLEEVLVIHKSVKVNMEVFGRYYLQTKENLEVKSFNSPNQVVDQSNDLNVIYNIFIDALTAQAMEFQHRDSGWTIEEILFMEVNVNKYSPLGGSSYIKLPKFIELKKSVVNVINQDQYCFAWAVTSALYPASVRVCEISSYPHFSTVLNVAGMDFPVKLKDIPKFEIMNDCSINVYGLEKCFKNGKDSYDVVGPLHYSKRRLNSHVNLLNIMDDSGNSHYCWIKDFSRLVSSQISAHEHRKYFCDGCLLYFSNERGLLRHQLNDCNHISTTTPTPKFRVDTFGIRGGVSQCSERQHIANNQFLPNYNPNEASSFIMYLDATNLYGHSMSQSLPFGGFTWLTSDEISKLDIVSIPDENSQGYILEVDIHYPVEMHDLHSDLPFLVESIIPPGSKSKIAKLIPNLKDKNKYIVHYRNLKQAIRNGLKLIRTHRVLRFDQSQWLKKYIDLNTKLRNEATNKFERNYFKLNVNSIYGKTLENVYNRRDIQIVTHWESIRGGMGANALIARPNFKTLSIIAEDFVVIHMDKVKNLRILLEVMKDSNNTIDENLDLFIALLGEQSSN